MANEKLTRLAGDILRYRYALDGTGEIAFDFNTLAEVGAPYQQWFKDEILRRGWTVDYGRDLDEKPYVADVLVSIAKPGAQLATQLAPYQDFCKGLHHLGFGTDEEIDGAAVIDVINAHLPVLFSVANTLPLLLQAVDSLDQLSKMAACFGSELHREHPDVVSAAALVARINADNSSTPS